MVVIGLTGGIGSGKSTVSQLLNRKGAHIIDADRLAREIVEPGQPALEDIMREFGADLVLPDGSLDRQKLGARVFNDPDARKKLNNLTHPRILERTDQLIEKAKAVDPNCVVVIDAPLLLEAGMDKMVDEVWLAAVDEDIQVKRVMKRDKLTLEQVKQRIASQMPLAEKKRYAHRIIDTGGSFEHTSEQVEKLWRLIKG